MTVCVYRLSDVTRQMEIDPFRVTQELSPLPAGVIVAFGTDIKRLLLVHHNLISLYSKKITDIDVLSFNGHGGKYMLAVHSVSNCSHFIGCSRRLKLPFYLR